VRRALFLSLACTLAIPAAGCGAGSGVSEGATVTVYVSGKSLCKGAREELARHHGRTGDFRLRMICLGDVGTLVGVGANARRATEDSSTVGYIGELDPTLARFSHPILEAAGIAQISTSSGTTAMARLLRAIRQAGGDSNLRRSVYEALG
jgi:hypothetical protein